MFTHIPSHTSFPAFHILLNTPLNTSFSGWVALVYVCAPHLDTHNDTIFTSILTPSLTTHIEYTQDDQPLYLFDPTFDRSAPELLQAYTIPLYFQDDLFSLLEKEDSTSSSSSSSSSSSNNDNNDAINNSNGNDTHTPTTSTPNPSPSRPDYRWLLIGGLRSGQSWHKDPNGTSAWNLTIRGRKRWLMFPPHITPPGVRRSADCQDFVTPISLSEWARDFYAETCVTPG